VRDLGGDEPGPDSELGRKFRTLSPFAPRKCVFSSPDSEFGRKFRTGFGPKRKI
jgi:hypothetical protein